MNGISFITDEVGSKTQIVIDLSDHATLLRKFFRKVGVDAEGGAPITPRKLRVTETGDLVPLEIDQEVAVVRAEAAARIKALEAKVADYEEKIEELENKVDVYEDKVEAYEKEKIKEEEEALKVSTEKVAESGKKVEVSWADKETTKLEKKGKVQTIIAKAESLLGTKHVLGLLGDGGIDCSGLTTVSFKEAGIALPRTSSGQSEIGKPVDGIEKLKPGDLVFFASGKPGKLNHVGIVHNSDNSSNIKFIHTSTSRGVIVSSLSSGFWSKCFLKARRVI